MVEQKKKRRSPWPWAIVGVFVVQACVLSGTMVMAARSPSMPEPDYYAKALSWDERAGAVARPRAEGWSWSVAGHGRLVTVTVADGAGEPLAGAAVEATAFHATTALDRHAVGFVETAPGVYRGSLPEQRAGVWELRFEIEHAGRPALLTERVGIE